MKEEGVLALYSGWSPAIARGLFYGGGNVASLTSLCRLLLHTGLTSGGGPTVANANVPSGC